MHIEEWGNKMYYAFIENGKLNGGGECRCLTNGVENIEISQEVFDNIQKYKYENGEIVINEDYVPEE